MEMADVPSARRMDGAMIVRSLTLNHSRAVARALTVNHSRAIARGLLLNHSRAVATAVHA